MRRITQLLAIAAALAASPALADEVTIPGFDQDPFSQTYSGFRSDEPRDGERAKDARKDEGKDTMRCDRDCPCGHHRAQRQPVKA
jgi:hypothetical protein